MVKEEHGVLFVVPPAQRVTVAADPLRDRLTAEGFEPRAVGGNGKGEDAAGIRPAHEGGRQGDIGLVREGRRGGELFGAVDDDPIPGLFDHVQHYLFLLSPPLLVLGLLTAVHLGVTQGVRQEEVVLQTVAVVVDDVLAKVTVRILDRAQRLANVVERDDIRR